MQIREQNSDADFSYLSINGLALTFDTAIMPSRSIAGPITSSGYTDRVSSRVANSLAVNLTLASGGSGNLQANFLVLDPLEPSNGNSGIPPSPLPPPLVQLPLVSGGGVTGPTTIRLVISNGEATAWVNNVATSLGAMAVPMLWQIQLQVSGTSPSLSVIGTYEEKR
jgi:hypothetical protein